MEMNGNISLNIKELLNGSILMIYCPFNIKLFSKIMGFLEKNKNGEFWFNIDKK